TIDFISAQVHEHRICYITARRFERIHRTYSVHIEIVKWPVSGEVMTRLSSRVYDHIWADFFNGPQKLRAASHIELMMGECGVGLSQPVLIPARISFGPKKIRAHVVVDTVHS